MNNELMFSSINQQWSTRWECFEQIQDYVGYEFNLDPCAEPETAKCKRFFTKEDDMFSKDLDWGFDAGQFAGGYWQSQVFCNPEYGRKQPLFVKENIRRIQEGEVSDLALLIPSRSDTSLFHHTILPNASCITFYEGRLVFGNDEYWEWFWNQEYLPDSKGVMKPNKKFGKVGSFNPAPFCSMVVEFNEESVLGLKDDLKHPKIATLKAPKFVYGYKKN